MGISKRYPPKPRWPRLAVIQEPTEVEHIPFMDSDVSKSRMGWLVGFSQFEKVGLTLGRWHDVLGLWTCHLPKHHSSCFSHFFWVDDRSTIPSSWLDWWTKYPKEMPKSSFKKTPAFGTKRWCPKCQGVQLLYICFFWGVLNIKVYGWIEKKQKKTSIWSSKRKILTEPVHWTTARTTPRQPRKTCQSFRRNWCYPVRQHEMVMTWSCPFSKGDSTSKT